MAYRILNYHPDQKLQADFEVFEIYQKAVDNILDRNCPGYWIIAEDVPEFVVADNGFGSLCVYKKVDVIRVNEEKTFKVKSELHEKLHKTTHIA